MTDSPGMTRPASPEEAVRAYAESAGRAAYVAGGTILVSIAAEEPELLVDLAAAGLSGIRAEGGGLVVGATTTMLELANDRECRRFAGGVLSQTAAEIGTHTVRGRATIGGNVAAWPYPSDMPVTLTALRAEVVLLATDGPRTVPFDHFYPAEVPDLRPGELIVGFLFPRPPEGLAGGFRRIGRPKPGAPAVNCASVGRLESGRLKDVRVVTNAFGRAPSRLALVEKALTGARPTSGALAETARRAAAVAEKVGIAPERAEALRGVVRESLSPVVNGEDA